MTHHLPPDPDQDIAGAAERFRRANDRYVAELKRRAAIEDSPEYRKMKAQVDALMLEMEVMLEQAPLDAQAYAEAKENLIAAMRIHGRAHLPGFHCKTRIRCEVVPSRVYEALGGDTDQFLSLVKITQKDVKEFAKSIPQLKQELLDCIEEKGEEVVDLEIVTALDK